MIICVRVCDRWLCILAVARHWLGPARSCPCFWGTRLTLSHYISLPLAPSLCPVSVAFSLPFSPSLLSSLSLPLSLSPSLLSLPHSLPLSSPSLPRSLSASLPPCLSLPPSQRPLASLAEDVCLAGIIASQYIHRVVRQSFQQPTFQNSLETNK